MIELKCLQSYFFQKMKEYERLCLLNKEDVPMWNHYWQLKKGYSKLLKAANDCLQMYIPATKGEDHE